MRYGKHQRQTSLFNTKPPWGAQERSTKMADIITVTGRAFKEGGEYWVFSNNKIYTIDPSHTLDGDAYIYWGCMPVGEKNAFGFKLTQEIYDAHLRQTTGTITVRLVL